jgi:hypothetical protein
MYYKGKKMSIFKDNDVLYRVNKDIFLEFLIASMNVLLPKQSEKISIKQSVDFINCWTEERFKHYKEEDTDAGH